MSEELKSSAAEPSLADEQVDVEVARDLLARARAEGVSLTGPGGVLSRITKTVLESAPRGRQSRVSADQ